MVGGPFEGDSSAGGFVEGLEAKLAIPASCWLAGDSKARSDGPDWRRNTFKPAFMSHVRI